MDILEWKNVKNQNLAIATRDAGFDLAMFKEYSPAVQKELKKKAIYWAYWNLDNEFDEQHNCCLSKIKGGVYVIRLSDPFVIEYDLGQSGVVYIGRGNISTRIKDHFKKTLFDFMLSLSGANFDFWVCEPKRPGGGRANNYFQQVEYDLLERFRKKTGGEDLPLLNKIAGTDHGLENHKDEWDKPLDNRGRRPKWVLKPTKHWKFSKLE